MITPSEVIVISSGICGIIGYMAGVRAGKHAGRIEGRQQVPVTFLYDDEEPEGEDGEDGWGGRWMPAPECPIMHPYGEEGWRPGRGDIHEHWVPDDLDGDETRAWLHEIAETGPAPADMGWMTAPDGLGDDTREIFERVASIPDHYAADPSRHHVLQAGEVARWGTLVGDWIEDWQADVMPAGDRMYAEAMAEMSAHLERLGSR